MFSELLLFMNKNAERFSELPPTIIPTYKCNRNCFYCSAKGLRELTPGEMKPEQFKKIINWLEKQGIKFAGISGGEPTIHSKFNELVKIALKKNFSFEIATNNLFNKNNRRALASSVFKSILVHFDKPGFYSTKQLNLFHENLGFLSEKPSRLKLVHNFFSEKTPHQHIFEACEKYNIKKTSMAIITPGILKQNPFVKIGEMDKLFPRIVSFIEQAESRGIEYELNNVLPKCAFSEKHREYLEEKKLFKSKCLTHSKKFNPIIKINPDLSANACPRTNFKRKDILKYKNLRELKESMEPEFEELKAKPLFEKCLECKHWPKECQGGCLIYKIIGENHGTKR